MQHEIEQTARKDWQEEEEFHYPQRWSAYRWERSKINLDSFATRHLLKFHKFERNTRGNCRRDDMPRFKVQGSKYKSSVFSHLVQATAPRSKNWNLQYVQDHEYPAPKTLGAVSLIFDLPLFPPNFSTFLTTKTRRRAFVPSRSPLPISRCHLTFPIWRETCEHLTIIIIKKIFIWLNKITVVVPIQVARAQSVTRWRLSSMKRKKIWGWVDKEKAVDCSLVTKWERYELSSDTAKWRDVFLQL